MNFGCPLQNRLRALFLGLAGAVAVVASAQESEPIRIQILQADAILRDRSQPDVQRLIGGVLLGMEDSRLRCDSAWRYDDGTFRTMGNVQLTDGPQTLLADEMELNPETQWVRAKSDADRRVQLDAEAGQLTCTVLRYHLKREVALLPSGGRLQDDGRSVEFQHGQYRAKTALLMLGGSVHMDNADYTLDSDSLHWREEVDEFSFHGPSHLRTTDERFELRCSSGEFDVETESGWFGGAGAPGVELRNDEVWLEADSVHLPPDTLLPATAVGEVDITDTLELWTLSGHYAERLERGEEFDVWVAGKPERRRTVACGSREVFGDQVPRPDASSRERGSPTRGRSSPESGSDPVVLWGRATSALLRYPYPLVGRQTERVLPSPGWGGALGHPERVLP